MPAADLGFVAAAGIVRLLPFAAWRWGSRSFRLIWLAATVLLALNLVSAWHLEHDAGVTIEGAAAAAGMMIAIGLFVLLNVVTVIASSCMRLRSGAKPHPERESGR